MTATLIPSLLNSNVIIIASPVYFNNVSGQVKVFMDRTWCIRGRLKDKMGGGIVVGRGYGLESALTAINAFMIKHEMILGHRGVSGTAYEKGEIMVDKKSNRILFLNRSLHFWNYKLTMLDSCNYSFSRHGRRWILLKLRYMMQVFFGTWASCIPWLDLNLYRKEKYLTSQF
jgi:multimeric flavodoxin WrbA